MRMQRQALSEEIRTFKVLQRSNGVFLPQLQCTGVM